MEMSVFTLLAFVCEDEFSLSDAAVLQETA